MTDIVDADVVRDEDIEKGRELVQSTTVGPLAVTPNVQATELVERLDVIKDAMGKAMTKGVDYGVIPGTGDKPTLLKPGAEKLGVLFQLDVQIDSEKIWGPDDHLTVMSRATAFFIPTGIRVGFGEGMCSTREKKYAKRRGELICPNCGKPAVIKGKAEYGGGFLCWTKKDGCGSKWGDDAPEITSQSVGDVDNPDLPDTWNTVVKMAEKRARVDVILAVTGASALFTQDAEDLPAAQQAAPSEPAAPPPAPEPAPPAETINRARAKGIVDDIWTVGLKDKARLAFTHVLGDDVGDCSTKAKAQLVAEKLTAAQAARLEAKIQQRADEQAQRADDWTAADAKDATK